MTGVLTGALGGARALLIGWFVPSLINLLVLGIVVVPGLSGLAALTGSGTIDAARSTAFILVGTMVLGLTLAALQTPLYRILEGYLGWPKWLFQMGRRHELARKHLLEARLCAASLALREKAGTLSEKERGLLQEYRAHVVTGHYVDSDARKGPVWLSLLDERLSRFPADDGQVIATRLGNAIRRFEEYGYNRFRLDSQVLWHELNAVAPEQARKQAEDARMNVDFFICLLYGHLLVAVSACIELGAGNPARPWLVAGTIIGLLVLACVWYRVAIVATDDWAGAVRAMVNLGRLPLTTSMGLALPQAIGDERAMWALAVDFVRYPYSPRAAALDAFRRAPEEADKVGLEPGGGAEVVRIKPDAGSGDGVSVLRRRGGRGLGAGGAQRVELGQQAEPELGAGDQRDDHDEKAEEDQHQLPAGIARRAEDPALVQPVALHARQRAGPDGAPAHGQAGRGHGRQLSLEIG
jgi:hypothetical protein